MWFPGAGGILFGCRVVALWKEELGKTNPKAAQSLADPMQYENLFPELKQALEAEDALKREREHLQPAASFSSMPVRERERASCFNSRNPISIQCPSDRNIFEELSQGKLCSMPAVEKPAEATPHAHEEVGGVLRISSKNYLTMTLQAFDLDNEDFDLDLDVQVSGMNIVPCEQARCWWWAVLVGGGGVGGMGWEWWQVMG